VGWFDEGGSGSAVDVTALLDCKAADLIHRMIAAGALVSLGVTSDGGALGVTVTVDGRWRREYFRDDEAMIAWCEEALEPVIEACADRSASSESRKRQRSPRRS
jgi:hypothetical protein